MGLQINSNLTPDDAQTCSLTTAKQRQIKAGRLSAGLRISTASDEASSLANSQLRRSELRLADEAYRNANDATALIQTALEALDRTCSNKPSSNKPSSSEQSPQKSKATVGRNDQSAESQQFTDLLAAIDAISQSATSTL